MNNEFDCYWWKRQKQIHYQLWLWGKPFRIYVDICIVFVCVIFPIFGTIQFQDLSFAALLCWTAKLGKKNLVPRFDSTINLSTLLHFLRGTSPIIYQHFVPWTELMRTSSSREMVSEDSPWSSFSNYPNILKTFQHSLFIDEFDEHYYFISSPNSHFWLKQKCWIEVCSLAMIQCSESLCCCQHSRG